MKIFRKLEQIFSAVAFAESGEHETAREILKEHDDMPRKKERYVREREEGKAATSPVRS